jgi:hypothetical protein
MEIPHIETRWDYLTNRDDYSINLYPSPRQISKVRLRTYALQNKFNPNPDGYKKCIVMRLGVIYDSQETNRKKGGLPARALTKPLVHSYWSPRSHLPAGRNTQIHQHKQVDALLFYWKIA